MRQIQPELDKQFNLKCIFFRFNAIEYNIDKFDI